MPLLCRGICTQNSIPATAELVPGYLASSLCMDTTSHIRHCTETVSTISSSLWEIMLDSVAHTTNVAKEATITLAIVVPKQ